jgi:hypothetical protein
LTVPVIAVSGNAGECAHGAGPKADCTVLSYATIALFTSKELIMSDNNEILVVASKLKNYIRSKSGMNTSASVMEVVSDRIRQMCDQAIENASNDKRKTVKDRDF